MKYLPLFLPALMIATPNAEARWYKHRHWHDDCCYAADVATGIISTTAGVMIANELINKPVRKHHRKRVYIYEPEPECYTIVSRKTGKVTQKCVDNPTDKIIYVD